MAGGEDRQARLKAPYPGKCLCGAVQFRLTEEPLTLYACHCTDCQKRSGSAFGLSLWVHRAAIQVIEGRPELNCLTRAADFLTVCAIRWRTAGRPGPPLQTHVPRRLTILYRSG